MRFAVILIFAMASAPACEVLAAEAAPVIGAEKLQPQSFPEFAHSLREEMEPGGRFGFVNEEEAQRVDKALKDMERILSAHRMITDLKEEEKIALINAQGVANAILTRRDRDRIICERRTLVGSHFPQSVCETYGEKMLRTTAAQKDMRERHMSHPLKGD